ncbi:MAG: DUF5049 domain-containing protein [Fastidiosipilaceae bacterium]|jgi:hypothetical protein
MSLKEQITAVRDSGKTNMLDSRTVQHIANEMNFYELVIFIEEHPDRYSKFIFTGDEKLLTD